jgi:hypothetical protein
VPSNATNEWAKEAYKEQIKHFFDRTLYSVPGVAVQLSSDDIGFVGPLVCFIASFYYAACVRVTRLSMSDVVRSIGTDPSLHEKAVTILQGEMVLNSVEAVEEAKGITPLRIYQLLIMLPAVAALAAVLTDAYSYAEGPWDNPGVPLIVTMTWTARIKASFFDGIGLLLTLQTWISLKQSYRFVEEIRSSVLRLRSVPALSVTAAAGGASSVQ